MAIARLLGGSLILGKYQTLKLLGQGGMGASFLGRCRTTGARVVIKQMHRELANHPVARALFDRELDVMRRFRHPFAVEMIDGGWHGDVPCLVLEYVDGITLEEYVARHGRIEPRRLGRWLGQLCLVLHAAHAAGILHRDLTLANLMLVDRDTAHEHIKVLDFGLAQRHGGVYVPLEKVVGAAASIGGGTPDYLCPEQIAGGPVDARSDIYSLGVVLYKLLTGHLPFEHADSVAGILQAQQHETPPRFACHGISDLPLPLEAVVRLCLEKDPNERPQTARELAELYAEALGEEIVPPQSFAESTMSPCAFAPRYDLSRVADRIEAWLPEPIAVMKLRAFVSAIGGEVVGSEPGLFRVRIRDPRLSAGTKRRFAWFGWTRDTLSADDGFLHLDLHMERSNRKPGGVVEIVVVLEAKSGETAADAEMRFGFGQRICRELRAYLISGR